MDKKYRRVISVLLASMLTLGVTSLPISAGILSKDDETMIPVMKSQRIENSIKPFTSTAELVKDTISDIIEKGERIYGEDGMKGLANLVERKSDYTLSEITTGIGRAFLSNSGTKRFDTSMYHLTEAEMSEVLERVLSTFYLKDIVSYNFDIDENDEVIGIEYELTNSFQVALDTINIGDEAKDELTTEIAAEAELSAAEAYREIYSEPSGMQRSYARKNTAAVMMLDDEGESALEESSEHECNYKLEYVWEDENCLIKLTYLCDNSEICDNTGLVFDISCSVTSAFDDDGNTVYTANPPVEYGSANIEGESTKTASHTHEYDDPIFELTYAEDGELESCTAVFECTICPIEIKNRIKKVECTFETDETNNDLINISYENPFDGETISFVKDITHEHTDGAPDYVWNEKNHTCKRVITCTECDEIVEKRDCEVISSLDEKTCEITYTAYYGGEEVSVYEITETHTPIYNGAPYEWIWSEDNTLCEAVFKCTCEYENCCYKETAAIDCNVTSHSNSKTGDVIYQAECEADGRIYKSVPVTVYHVHSYSEGNFTWSEDYLSCTATFVCDNCKGEITDVCIVTQATEGNITTYTATSSVKNADGEPFSDTKVVELKHQHTFDIEQAFTWEEYYGENTETYKTGMLFYDKNYVPAENDGIVYYDSNSGIGVSMARNLMARCNSVQLKCTDENCGYSVSSLDEGTELTVETGKIGEEAFYNPNTWTEYGSDILTAVFTYTDDEGKMQTVSNVYNLTTARLTRHYAEMISFNNAYPQYFGVAAPFWTDKNTDATPFDAIKTLINQAGNFVPNSDMDAAIEGLTMAFISYVMNYGPILDFMLEDAMDCLTNDMSDIQKMLVLHDWLAKNATFDMNSLIELKAGGSGGDPITMTAFGTLLSGQFSAFNPDESTYGAVCLGYAATYQVLIQHAFPKNYMKGNEWLIDGADHIVDFVQIKFHANVADSSVAGSNSGFGDGDAIFNEPHYFNAIRLDSSSHGLSNSADTPLDENGYCWYYTDACYDDISVEVISQYRVETDGNISHMYFLSSPQSFLDMFDGNFDYFDSAYDGKEFYTVPELDENGNPKFDSKMNIIVKTDDEGFPIWYAKDSETEIAYNDDQFEKTWFSNAKSEIIYYQKNWYYIEGSASSYSSLKDLFGDNDNSSGGSFGDYGDMMDNGQMLEYKNDPDNADKLMVRPSGKGDRPENANSSSGGMGMGSQYEDKYASVLFHYGYGAVGPVAKDTEITDENRADYPWYDLVQVDIAYNNEYPDLNHSLGMMYNSNSDKNSGYGKLYFNLANRIMVYDIDKAEVEQLKEYNVVKSVSDERPFEGMSYFTPETADGKTAFTVTDKPIASIMINDMVYWTDEYVQDSETGEYSPGQDGKADTRNVIPALYVSIATNYSNSFVVNDEPYSVEAVNFNPDYYRFMDDDDSDEEKNTNVEFMWCANIVDIMRMDDMLNELLNDSVTETYTMNATCRNAAFTEERTVRFGLSNGSTKVISETEPALDCHYFYRDYSNTKNNIDSSNIGFVCFRCNGYEESVSPSLKHNNEAVSENVFKAVWSDGGKVLASCIHLHSSCPIADCLNNSAYNCSVTEITDEVTGEKTGYNAACPECGEVKTYNITHEHIEGVNLEHHEAVEATCINTGSIEYWVCTDEFCGHYLVKETDDETGETVFVEIPEENIIVGIQPHSLSQEPNYAGKKATCVETGMNPYWTCTVCSKHFDNAKGEGEAIPEEQLEEKLSTEIDPSNHGAELEHHEAVEATCVNKGMAEYWTCTACSKHFNNAEGEGEAIPEEQLEEKLSTEIDPSKHVSELEHHEAVEATCVSKGTAEYWTCKECKKNFDEKGIELKSIEIPVNPDNHAGDTEIRNAVNATDKEEGYTGDKYCKDCDKLLEKGKTIPVTEPKYTLGDVNNDGKIDNADVILIRHYIAGGFTFEVFIEEAADVNCDGKIDSFDVILLRRYIVGGFDVILGQSK